MSDITDFPLTVDAGAFTITGIDAGLVYVELNPSRIKSNAATIYQSVFETLTGDAAGSPDPQATDAAARITQAINEVFG